MIAEAVHRGESKTVSLTRTFRLREMDRFGGFGNKTSIEDARRSAKGDVVSLVLAAILARLVASRSQVGRETEPEAIIANATVDCEASLLAVVELIKAAVLHIRALETIFLGARGSRDRTVWASFLLTKITKMFTLDREDKKYHEQGYSTIHLEIL